MLCAFAASLSRPRVRVRVEASHTGNVGALLQRTAGWGSVLFNGESFVPREGCAVLTAVAGRTADGREVVALLDEPLPQAPLFPPMSSVYVNARAEACFTKPSVMSVEAASQFPLLALRAAVALDQVGCSVAKIGNGSDHPPVSKAILVAGSAGRLPALLVQLLFCCGVYSIVAARSSDAEGLSRLGANRVLDHNREDWAQHSLANG